MKTELLTRQSDFLPVAQHGALLFTVICELQKLHPYYRFPLDAFVQLFHDTVAERNRGKKSSGSPAARAAELVTALSRKIFERTSWSLFQSKWFSDIQFLIDTFVVSANSKNVLTVSLVTLHKYYMRLRSADLVTIGPGCSKPDEAGILIAVCNGSVMFSVLS